MISSMFSSCYFSYYVEFDVNKGVLLGKGAPMIILIIKRLPSLDAAENYV